MKRGPKPAPIKERLMKHVMPDESGCWLWQARTLPNGYGVFGVARTTQLAHRISYQVFRGAIPEGLDLDHLCRVRHCVNPAHLEPVTAKENNLRGAGFGAINARKTVCKNGHQLTELNVYVTPRGSRNCRECRRASARRYLRHQSEIEAAL